MSAFLGQLIFLAKRNDFEGLMQILILVAVMVVYALSAILKAKTRKTKPEEGKEKPQRPRPAGPVPRPKYQQGAQPQFRKIARPQPAVQKLSAKAEQDVQIPTVEPSAKLKLSKPMPQVPELTSETVKGLEGKLVSPLVPTETPEGKYLYKILLDYANPDELRRAILHYEILGKPMSLRGPGEQIIGF